jgi:GNAT superfamily N-acetyltransferase
VRIALRRAGGDDGAQVAGLYLRARAAASAAGAIPPAVHDARQIREWIDGRVITELDCWLAETESGALVGMLVLDDDWIDQLYVEPERTGQGVGATLIAAAKRERPGGLRLWTFAANLGARRFYLRHGFREVARTDGAGNEEQAPDIQYEWIDRTTSSSGRDACVPLVDDA